MGFPAVSCGNPAWSSFSNSRPYLSVSQPEHKRLSHIVVQCSQMFADIEHSITIFNEHFFDVCENISKFEKVLCLAGVYLHRCSSLLGLNKFRI